MTASLDKPPQLSGLKALLIVVIMALWLTSLALILASTQTTHSTTPALLLHTSSMLVLLLLVRLSKGHWKHDLAIQSSRFYYLIVAAFIGFAFWQIQQFTNALLNPDTWQHDALQWQQSQTGFSVWSVFMASCLIGPVFEELLFRGLIYTQIKHKTGFLLATLVSSGLFTTLHWNLSEALWLFSAGVIYAVIREKSGSIWPPVIAHIIQNVLTFWLYVSI